jgi:hypothetical protein
MQKRFIEYDLPLAEISEQSAQEKTHCVKVNPRTVGAVRLSSNECNKTRHFNDRFRLHIVTQAVIEALHFAAHSRPGRPFSVELGGRQ